MSNGFDRSQNKQTAYSGFNPSVGQGTAYAGPTIKTSEGTVYNGPVVPPRGSASAQGQRVANATFGHTHKSGNVFFLIAGLSMLNTFLAMSGAAIALALGLGITRMFDASVREGGSVGPVLAVNATVAGVFVLIGIFSRQGSSTAILVGLLLYGADTVLLAIDGITLHIPSLIVHAIFLVSIFRSYRMAQA
jgi:hypothetical protein